MRKILLGFLLLSGLGARAADEWSVTVDGRSLALARVNISTAANEPAENLGLKGVWYDHATFALATSAEVRVTSSRPLGRLEILPSPAVPAGLVREGNTLSFTATAPFKLSFCPEGRVGALHLFASRPERVPPGAAAETIYYGRGTYEVTTLALRSNQRLHLAEGALVYGHLEVRGTNVTVCGAGTISGAHFARFKGPGAYSNAIVDATNVTIRGVTFTDPYGWSVGVRNSRNVTIEDVKVLGGRMINDDGIDIINSSAVTVRDTFVRTQDDNIGLKGLGYAPDGRPFAPVEDIRVEGCQLWTDQANNFRIGFECDAAYIRDVRVRNVEVLAGSPIARNEESFWGPGAVFRVQASGGLDVGGLDFRDVRVNASGNNVYLASLESALTWSRRGKEGRHRYETGGTIHDCRFENIEVVGTNTAYGAKVRFVNRSPTEGVTNVVFENVWRFGERVTASDRVITGAAAK